MRDTENKTDGISTLSAETFNQMNTELENCVKSSGLGLDPEIGPDSDLYMLAKTTAAYSGCSWSYNDIGSANNYLLSRTTSFADIFDYQDGLTIIFKPANTNTGASTVNVSNIGIKNITRSDGSALSENDIVEDEYVILSYNETDDRFEIVLRNIFATDSETEEGLLDDKAITPSGLTAISQVGNIDNWPESISVPSGFLACNGAAISRTTYANLFSVIGETFGNGDGSTTFNLPDIGVFDGGNSENIISIIKY